MNAIPISRKPSFSEYHGRKSIKTEQINNDINFQTIVLVGGIFLLAGLTGYLLYQNKNLKKQLKTYNLDKHYSLEI